MIHEPRAIAREIPLHYYSLAFGVFALGIYITQVGKLPIDIVTLLVLGIDVFIFVMLGMIIMIYPVVVPYIDQRKNAKFVLFVGSIINLCIIIKLIMDGVFVSSPSPL